MTAATLPTDGVDLARALAPLSMLPGDPTVRLVPGRLERASTTPEGPGTVVVRWDISAAQAVVETFGDGAGWLAQQVPGLLGLHDDPSGFAPDSPALRDLWRRHRGDRVAATGTLWHDLAWFVLKQRVTRGEAAAQWARLVRALGSPAPGPVDLLTPPSPAVVGRLRYDQLHRFGIERQRAENLLAAARFAHHLHARPEPAPAVVLDALQSVRGVGPWTTGCLAAITYGEADTVITGDSGIPSMVAWLLAREQRADDTRMLELLEPYRPHRYRVIRLAFAAGLRPPRRSPRTRSHEILGR